MVQGLGRLFDDLTRVALGVDPERLRRRVALLPESPGWVFALPRYAVREGGLIGAPFHAAVLDYFQLALGKRARIVWLHEMEDLKTLLLDPAVTHLVLGGHGSMRGYSFEGLAGLPAETIARVLSWLRRQAEELAPLVAETAENSVAVYNAVAKSLGAGWRAWDLADFETIAATPGFRKKKLLILFACSVDEIHVAKTPEEFRGVLLSVLSRSPETTAALEARQRGDSFFFSPLSPSANRSFREALPTVLSTVAKKLGKPLQIEAQPDFVGVVAEESRRFPGLSWVHDFLRNPEGHDWDAETYVQELREALTSTRTKAAASRVPRRPKKENLHGPDGCGGTSSGIPEDGNGGPGE